MNNPLLNIKDLPGFSAIRAEHVEAALDYVLAENRQLIASLTNEVDDEVFTWENFVEPLDIAENQLERCWSPVSHLNAVMNSEALRDAYNNCLPKLSEYSAEVGQNRALFEAVSSIAERQETLGLNTAQRKSLDDSIRGFRLSGVDLPKNRQTRFKEISQKLSLLASRFSDNVLDATNAWSRQVTDTDELAGLPESALDMARQAAKERDQKGWVLTLDFPSFNAVMTYADNADLRKEVYRAYTTRASDQGDNPDFDNSEIMLKILKLRQEKAKLLGFEHYAALSLDGKMAETADEVMQFLQELARKSLSHAKKEQKALAKFAKKELGIKQLEAWDMGYASEKLRQQLFDFTEEELKPYFSVDQVLDGLFKLVEKLYNVSIQQKEDVDVWQEDVRFYEIHTNAGVLKARFYLDLYARQHKRGGAWMADFCNRFRQGDALQTPVAFMTCNSAPPTEDKPALFTHDEVITLFHEFGHGLHHMMTKVDYLNVAGISGVEWDAVELPSQFMENWCWQREVLDTFAQHYETGEKLPDTLFEKMLDARHFQSAKQMMRQLEFAIFDMRIHRAKNITSAQQIQSILNDVRKEVAVAETPEFNRFQHGFSHIFAGGYAAGYYSYKWAEVLSADAFARFEEEGLFNQKVGNAFLKEVLEKGGSRPAMESFKAFRGREPKVDALLRHSGLAA